MCLKDHGRKKTCDIYVLEKRVSDVIKGDNFKNYDSFLSWGRLHQNKFVRLCVSDLDKLNLVKLGYGGSVLVQEKFCYSPSCLKK